MCSLCCNVLNVDYCAAAAAAAAAADDDDNNPVLVTMQLVELASLTASHISYRSLRLKVSVVNDNSICYVVFTLQYIQAIWL